MPERAVYFSVIADGVGSFFHVYCLAQSELCEDPGFNWGLTLKPLTFTSG